jgi:vacuolar-type H+-ATPase catalytic subunit A/Vma1
MSIAWWIIADGLSSGTIVSRSTLKLSVNLGYGFMDTIFVEGPKIDCKVFAKAVASVYVVE